MKYSYTIVIPAYNEEGGIGAVLGELEKLPRQEFEIIVVDDHSSDKTAREAAGYSVRVLSNIENFGYGYSLKRGITEATKEHIIIMDGDGSYPASALPKLIEEYERGFDMVVGIRQGVFYRGGALKRVARILFRALSEFTTGRTIPDINSGMRIFRKDIAVGFFHTLSSGFSFTTTITLAFMLNAYSVKYVPIEYHKRKGSSKVRYFRDTLRASQIIVEAIVFYNPIKMFFLCAAVVFLTGCISIGIALVSPMLALLIFLTIFCSILIFCIGFIAVFLKFMYNGARSATRDSQ